MLIHKVGRTHEINRRAQLPELVAGEHSFMRFERQLLVRLALGIVVIALDAAGITTQRQEIEAADCEPAGVGV